MVTLAYLYGIPTVTADFKTHPSDFIVEEDLGFEPEGDGEHVVVYMKKEGHNTQLVADRLAQFAGISSKQVSYSGLKDKHAITFQWFGLHMPGQATPDFCKFELKGCQPIKVSRQRKKLRIGVHKGNQFTLLLRNVSDKEELDKKLNLVFSDGILNYFGEQRFGTDQQNIHQARQWALGEIAVKDRKKRAFYLSAARSVLFNGVVSRRVTEGLHQTVLNGDVVQLQGSGSWFIASSEELKGLQNRLTANDVRLTGPLFGVGELDSKHEGRAFELRALEKEPLFLELVRRERMQMSRRPLMVDPLNYQWQWDTDQKVVLKFWLPTGSYATSVLRELIR